MSVYNNRAMVSNPSNRIIEMLDAIRVEYDQLGQEAYMSKSQRDEFEHKSKLHCLGVVVKMGDRLGLYLNDQVYRCQ